MTTFKLSRFCICILNTLLICVATLSVSSCDRHSEYSNDKVSGKKVKLRKQDQIWERVRKNFDMAAQSKVNVQPARVQHYVKQYAGAYQKLDKASPYMYYIIDQVEKRDMPGEIALLPMIESAFEPQATSHAAAAGLWQFIPSTGKHFGLKQDKYYDGRRDVTASTKAALDYLELLHKQFDNNWMLALAAYNAGEGTIQKAIKKNIRKGKATKFWDLDLPKETKEYVPKLMALAEVVNNPEKHNISLPSIANKPYFEPVNLGKAVDLHKVAKLADIEVHEMKRLNPGYKKTHTHPTGPQELLVPVDKVATVKRNMNQVSTVTSAAADAADAADISAAAIAMKGKPHLQAKKKKGKIAYRGKGKKRSVKHSAKGKSVKSKKASVKPLARAKKARRTVRG